VINTNIPVQYDKYTSFIKLNEINETNVIYNGAANPDEDPADYIRMKPIKAVKVG
jgi:hypothetical protein